MTRSNCSCDTCGPCSVAGSNGSPTLRLFAFVDQLLDELVVDLLLDEQPAAGAAALALVEEQAEVRALDGGVEVGVGEDDEQYAEVEQRTEPAGIAGSRRRRSTRC